MASISKFLLINDKELKIHKLRSLIPEKRKPAGRQAYKTEQIRKMLEFADTLRNKAIIHCLSAGGFRTGVFEEMKWKHLSEMPNNCYCVTVYPESTHEYVTFLHHEARKALDEYTEERRRQGEIITPESFVFVNHKSIVSKIIKPITSQTVGGMLQRIVKKSKVQRVKSESGKRYDISIGNGFRKRFNTILKSNPNISFAIAERMMDHKTYLESVYLDTSDRIKYFQEYQKAMPDLILSDSERIIQELHSQKDERVAMLENKLANIEKLLQGVDLSRL
jgi:integrase